MKINRAVVKQQAKDIIKGNILKLFFISLIIGILAGGSVSFNNSDVSKVKEYFNNDGRSFSEKFSQDFDEDEDENDNPFGFGEFTTQYDENFFDEFDGKGMVTVSKAALATSGIFAGALALVALAMVAKGLFLGPLNVMLDGLYWQLIKGNNMDMSESFGFIFKKTFDKNYWNKFFLNLIRSLLLGLLYCLFIIPGVVYTYKWYFATYILAEKPELKFEEAMKLSDKMTKGHKWELFVMDLSFLGWYLLLIPTIGILSIYVTPYVSTTKALYYENYKLRAFQEGAITQYDYMTVQEKMYNQPPVQTADYYNYAHSVPDEAYRAQPVAAPVQPMPQANYYQPAQPVPPVQENNYYQPTPPVQPAAPVPPVSQPEAQTTVLNEPTNAETIEYVQSVEVGAPVTDEIPEIQEAPAPAEYYTPTEPPQDENV